MRPVLLWDTAYLTLLVALVGTSVAPWMQFYLQAAVVILVALTSVLVGITVRDMYFGSAHAPAAVASRSRT